jgi:hypothetical protein
MSLWASWCYWLRGIFFGGFIRLSNAWGAVAVVNPVLSLREKSLPAADFKHAPVNQIKKEK